MFINLLDKIEIPYMTYKALIYEPVPATSSTYLLTTSCLLFFNYRFLYLQVGFPPCL